MSIFSMILKLLVILEFTLKSSGIGTVDNVNVSYSMSALTWGYVWIGYSVCESRGSAV